VIKTFIKQILGLNSLPGYIISKEPFIMINYWQDFYNNYKSILKTLDKTKNIYLLFQLGWQFETEDRMNELVTKIKEIESYSSHNLKLYFLCNSKIEENNFQNRNLNGIFCHQNAFLDENRYFISNKKKIYDAIYLARITPFKRYELTKKLSNLKIIGNYHNYEKEYAKNILNDLKDADWTKKVLSFKVSKYLNMAKVGLALSKEEGAMFVSAEYLLSGIPVVSTNNMGGRDEFFKNEYVEIVEDSPEAVKVGVDKLSQISISPKYIRDETIKRMQLHRKKFIQIINQIYKDENIDRDFNDEWNKIYYHKMGLRTFLPFYTKWFRTLKE